MWYVFNISWMNFIVFLLLVRIHLDLQVGLQKTSLGRGSHGRTSGGRELLHNSEEREKVMDSRMHAKHSTRRSFDGRPRGAPSDALSNHRLHPEFEVSSRHREKKLPCWDLQHEVSRRSGCPFVPFKCPFSTRVISLLSSLRKGVEDERKGADAPCASWRTKETSATRCTWDIKSEGPQERKERCSNTTSSKKVRKKKITRMEDIETTEFGDCKLTTTGDTCRGGRTERRCTDHE